MSFTTDFLSHARKTLDAIDPLAIDRVVQHLVAVRARGGRVFFVGVGGSAANCGHAVNDFRKLCNIEAYAPTDNVSELTARTNDDGWETVFSNWLRTSRLNPADALFVLSVGGGDLARNISPNLVRAVQLAREVNATVLGIVGRDGGFTAKVANDVVLIPTVDADAVTPLAESFQAVVWHLLVSHPALKANPAKWESAVAA